MTKPHIEQRLADAAMLHVRADDEGDLAAGVKNDAADAENRAVATERDEGLLVAAVEIEQAVVEPPIGPHQPSHAQPYVLGIEAPEEMAIGGTVVRAKRPHQDAAENERDMLDLARHGGRHVRSRQG